MEWGFDSARSDDTGMLKYKGLGWIMKDPTTPLTPAIPSGASSKALRSFYNECIAAVLCPLEWPATQRCEALSPFQLS
jgi:hypothetical protein